MGPVVGVLCGAHCDTRKSRHPGYQLGFCNIHQDNRNILRDRRNTVPDRSVPTPGFHFSEMLYFPHTFRTCNRRLLDLLFPRTENRKSLSLVAPLDKLSVVLVAILGCIFLSEKLEFRNWVGIFLIAVGAVLVGLKRTTA